MACGFQGNSDIFGIGIRAAYYLQVFAVWFSNCFYYSETKVLRAVNKVFLLAIIVAGLIFFLNPQQYHVIEAFLLLQIGIVTGLVGITEGTRYSTQYRATSKERLVIRIFIMISGALFNVVFWWIGLDIMIPTPCDGANGLMSATYAFYGWKFNIYGWLRIVMKVQSIWVSATVTMMHVSRDGTALFFSILMREKRAAFVSALGEQEPSESSTSPSNFASRQQMRTMPSEQNSIFRHLRMTGLPSADAKCAKAIGHNPKNEELAQISRATSSANRKLLREVFQAEQYLESLYSIYTANDTFEKTGGCDRRRSCGSLRAAKQKQKLKCTDQTPYTTCLWTWTVATATNTPSVYIRNILFFHEIATGVHAPYQTPRLVNRMYNLALRKSPPDWRSLKIASDIHLSQVRTTQPPITIPQKLAHAHVEYMARRTPVAYEQADMKNLYQIPSTTTTRTWATQAILQFIFIVLLIVQVELTIMWNGVSGLQSFSNLGQLIPFIIGLGGLIKVLWGKACLVWEGRVEEPEKYEKPGEYETAMARYVENKTQADRRPVPVRVATA